MKPSEFKFIDLCLYMPKHKILVLGDLHLGYEESLNKKGVYIPRFQFKDTLKKLQNILTGLELEKIIILGDLKHEFGSISRSEWLQTEKLISFLKKYCKEIILVKGNHDTILGNLRKGLIVKDYFMIDNIYFCHGHKIQDNTDFKKCKKIVIGHEHPAIGLKHDSHVEKFKCFIIGKYLDKEIIVLPSFNLVTKGTNILSENILSPFLKNIDNFNVHVVSDNCQILDFGKLKNLKYMGLPGFEPGSSSPKPERIDQATLQPL